MMASSGRNDQASTEKHIDILIETYRNNYTYPSWFNNTLGYAENGQISAQALQNAANNLLNEGHMKPKPNFLTFTGEQNKAIDQRIKTLYGDDIKRLDRIHAEQEKRITAAKRPKSEVEQILIDYYGDDIKRLDAGHANQEDRISSHTHANTTTPPNECEWWNIFCKMQTQIDEGFQGLGKLALIGGLAVGGIFLLKMRLGK